MRYLTLTSTQECVKLARALIGSPVCGVGSKLVGVTEWKFIVEDLAADTDAGQPEVTAWRQVALPIDTLVLNLPEVCETGTQVVSDDGRSCTILSYNSDGSFVTESNDGPDDEDGSDFYLPFSGDRFRLDLCPIEDNVIEGATITNTGA